MHGKKRDEPANNEMSDQEIAQRRDEALRRALNTPPKQHKDMKKGKSRKRREEHPTASEKRT